MQTKQQQQQQNKKKTSQLFLKRTETGVLIVFNIVTYDVRHYVLLSFSTVRYIHESGTRKATCIRSMTI